jgi:hypothetical protein
MSPVLHDEMDREVIRRLDDYAESLRAEAPSAELDARMEATIAQWAAEQRKRSLLRRPLAWVVAAASLAVIAGGIALLAIDESGDSPSAPDALAGASTTTSPLPELSARTAVSPLATGSQVSLFPAEGAVFRVKANLASAMIPTSAGQPANGERQYWVDVRIANDGTMRIMQVLPAEHSRIVPRE